MYELKYTKFGTARKEENGYWRIISKTREHYGEYVHDLEAQYGDEYK